MGSATALWFDIETTFAELEELCIEARAAELVVQHRADEKRIFQTMRMPVRGAESETESTNTGQRDRSTRPEELARDLAFAEAHPNGADLVELRSRVRKRLTWLKGKIAEVLAEHEVYYTLFPIVVYADEMINGVTRSAAMRWEPLQSELYEIDNGGEVFYTILDDRLRQEETHPLVFEVFYYCLNDGFCGAYASDSRKIDEYKARLLERIRTKPIETDAAAKKEVGPVELVKFPWRYHAIAAGTVLGAYVLFSWLGWLAN
ncbi:MAG TPA: DotU family type IV/VI secretion system protein [Labilithrix sp.]|nr:DotU family type IV/VI secretion system protein [Labilithrix sp.]